MVGSMLDNGRWPFLGRDDAVQQLLAQLAQGRHIVLAGPPGNGKSRLAAEVAQQLESTGVLVRRIAASPAVSPIPLAPFAALLDGAISGDVVGAVFNVLDVHGRNGAGAPLLVVDDTHLLDDTSATIVHQLALSGRVRLLCTLRSTASPPAAISRFRGEPTVTNIDVPPLAADDIIAMVEHALGSPLDGRSRVALTSVCGGNPLYAKELVQGSLAAGTLVARNNIWRFTGDPAPTSLLEEVVLARLAPLAGAALEAIELLAIGGQIDHRLLSELVGADTIDALERSGMVRGDAGPQAVTVDVAHPLHRELMRTRLGPLSRMRIYHRLATAAESHPAVTEAAELTTAVWHVRGGVAIESDRLLAAARQANAAGDTPLALELAQVAHQQSASADSALLVCWCLAAIGQHDEAIELLQSALSTIDGPWDRAAVFLRLAEEFYWSGRTEQGLVYLDSATTGLPQGPWTDLLDAQRGVFAVLDGDIDTALRLGQASLQNDDLWVRFVATIATCHALNYLDRTDEASEVAATLLAEAQEWNGWLIGDPNLHVVSQLFSMLYGGDITDSLTFARLAYATTITQPSQQARAWSATLAGEAALHSGDAIAAARFLAEAEQLWADTDAHGLATWCATELVVAHSVAGSPDEARESLARATAYNRDGFRLHDTVLHIGRAWVASSESNQPAVVEHLREAHAVAAAAGSIWHLCQVLYDATRLGALDLLRELQPSERPTGKFTSARWDFAAARVAADPEALEAAGEAFAVLGAALAAAEALALAAVEFRRLGRTRDATRCDGRVGTMVATCAGTNSPPLATRTGSGPLSAREAEIAGLAATGLSNRQIAERLVVSERTVENHLYRVFIKLDVTTRDDLAAALTR